MKRVYLASPYSHRDRHVVLQRVNDVRRVCAAINERGRPSPVGTPEVMERRAWFIKACRASCRMWVGRNRRRQAHHRRNHAKLNARHFAAARRSETEPKR